MIDLNHVSIGKLHVLGMLQDVDPDREVGQTTLRQHENGYWTAQAAGHALLRDIDARLQLLKDIPTYVMDHMTGEAYDSPAWFEAEVDARLAAVAPAATHALSIARAQGRDDATTRMLRDGIDCAVLWTQLTKDQRHETSHVRYTED